jgi:cytochrome c peroxidase
MDEAVRDMALYQCDVLLSDAEVASIVAFLRTLTGEYQGKKLTSDNEYGVVLNAENHTHEEHEHE